MDLILIGRRVNADEALAIGLCEYVAADDEARNKAESLAHDIARFPRSCMLADRRSARAQHGLPMREALKQEWRNSKAEVSKGIGGAIMRDRHLTPQSSISRTYKAGSFIATMWH